jgi:WD40 repeat protein
MAVNERYLASGLNNGRLTLWDIQAEPKVLWRYEHTDGIGRLVFSPDGNKLAAGSCAQRMHTGACMRGQILVWNLTLGTLLSVTGQNGFINDLAFSADGQYLVTGSCAATDVAGSCLQGSVQVWEVATLHPVGIELTDHTFLVTGVAFSPDGKFVASASQRGVVLLHDWRTGQRIGQRLSGTLNDIGIVSIAFSPDGSLLAAGTCGVFNNVQGCVIGNIAVWDVATQQLLGPGLRGHPSQVFRLAFSADSRTLYSIGSKTIMAWDMNPLNWGTRACRIANRDFTEAEWKQYFGADAQTPTCPLP